MEIVRIEHIETGVGIFRSRDKNQNNHGTELPNGLFNDILNRFNNFPSPYNDGALGYVDYDEYCAFKTVNQLNKWITKDEIKEFFKIGFRVYLLTVDRCKVGDKQVIYKKDHVMNKKDITDLFL